MAYTESSRFALDIILQPSDAPGAHEAVGLWWAQAALCVAITDFQNSQDPQARSLKYDTLVTKIVPRAGVFAYEVASSSFMRSVQTIGTEPGLMKKGGANILFTAATNSGMPTNIFPAESYTHINKGIVYGKLGNMATGKVWPPLARP